MWAVFVLTALERYSDDNDLTDDLNVPTPLFFQLFQKLEIQHTPVPQNFKRCAPKDGPQLPAGTWVKDKWVKCVKIRSDLCK